MKIWNYFCTQSHLLYNKNTKYENARKYLEIKILIIDTYLRSTYNVLTYNYVHIYA